MIQWRRLAPRGAQAAACLVSALFTLCVYRAATQSITADEAFSWRLFLSGPPARLFNSYDASHHVLHSILCWISIHLFGLSELTLRIPSLLGAAFYFLAVWRLCRDLFGEGWLMFASVSLLSLNPFVLDYLSVARGYGMAVALCLWSVLYMVRYLDRLTERDQVTSRRRLYRIAIALTLSICANLTLLPPVLGFAVVFLSVLLAQSAWTGGWEQFKNRLNEIVDWFIVPGVALCFVILALPLTKARMDHFYVGTQSWKDTIESLIVPSFYHHELIWSHAWYSQLVAWLISAIRLMFAPILALAGLVCVLALFRAVRCRSFTTLSVTDHFLLLTGGSLFFSAAVLTVAHRYLAVPYPVARTGLYFVPLCCLVAIALWKKLRSYRAIAALRAPLALLTSLVIAQFALQLQTTHYGQWRYDASTKKIMAMIRQRCREKGHRYVRVGISWVYEPSLEFYRRLYKLDWIAPFTREGPEGNYDYYVLLPSDAPLLKQEGLRVLYKDPLSGAILAEPER